MKHCRHCNVELTDDNWRASFQRPRNRHLICTPCAKEKEAKQRKNPKRKEQLANSHGKWSKKNRNYLTDYERHRRNKWEKPSIDDYWAGPAASDDRASSTV